MPATAALSQTEATLIEIRDLLRSTPLT